MLPYLKILLYFLIPGNFLGCLLSYFRSLEEEGIPSKSSPTPGIIISLIGFAFSAQSLHLARNSQGFDLTRVVLFSISTALTFITFVAGCLIEPAAEALVSTSLLATISSVTTLIFSIVGADKGEHQTYQTINNEIFLVRDRSQLQYVSGPRRSSRRISFICLLFNLLLLACVGLISFHTILCATVPAVPGSLIKIKTGASEASVQFLCSGERTAKNNFTVLLEHGGGSNFLSMQPLLKELEGTYRVCGYSRLGFAWSEAGELPRSREKITQEVESLLQEIGEEPPYFVIGHSAGGEAAKAFAKKNPESVKGIVLLDSVDIINWFMVDSSSSDWRVALEVQKGQIKLLSVLRDLSVLGLQYFFIGADGYPEESKAAQLWSMMLDSNWNSQYFLFKNSLDNYQSNYLLEKQYLTPGFFNSTNILVLPAGLNSTCDQRGLVGQACDTFMSKDRAFLDLQMKTMGAGGPLSKLVICDYPCAHDFAWTRPKWIASKIKPWIEAVSSRDSK